MKALKRAGAQAVEAAESLTGRRFGLLVASSLVATTAIVATGLNSASGGSGPLAALLGQSLASDSAPVAPATSGQGDPSPVSPGSTGTGAGVTASPAPAPIVSASPSPSPTPTESKSPGETTDSSETPSAPEPAGPVGPIKHVVVISLATPGYEQSFGAASQMPYLSTDLVPKGQLVPGYSLLDLQPAAEQRRADQRPAPQLLDQGRLHGLRVVPDQHQARQEGTGSGLGLHLSGRSADARRPDRRRPHGLARLHRGHGR